MYSFLWLSTIPLTSLVAQMVKRLPTMRETGVWSLGREDPLERKWQPTPVLLPGKCHGWKSMVGCSSWGHKESDTTEQLHFTSRYVLVAQPRPTLCDPTNYSLPGFSVHGILQAKILEWIAIPFSRGYSSPGSNPGFLNPRQILNHLSYREVLEFSTCPSVQEKRILTI